MKEELTLICFVHFIWEHIFRFTCVHTVPCFNDKTDVYVQHVHGACMCCMDSDKQSDTRRLPSSATDTYVWPACGHKAMFAVALERTGSVHTASVLAWSITHSRFCTLINVWKKKNTSTYKRVKTGNNSMISYSILLNISYWITWKRESIVLKLGSTNLYSGCVSGPA